MNITNIPAPRVPFIDERTGLMAREWYRFFLNLFVLTGSGNNPITLEELQLGPPNQPDLAELLIQINQNIAPQYEDQSGDFLATLDTAQLMSMMSRFENAEAAIQGAYLQPVVQTGTIANYNLDNSPTAGGIVYGTGPALAVSAAGTLGQVLTSAGAGTPTWSTAAAGTVSSVSVVSANGLAGTVATATTTPAITLSTTVTGLLKGNGTAISAATSGTDYAPATSGTSILYGNGSGGFSNVTIGTGVAFAGGTLSATGSGGTVTSVTGTAPVVSSGGATPAISMAAATTSVNGYLTSTDWTTFNNKGSGTVTSVAALTLGTTGTDLSSTVANGTTTPVITLQVPTASASNRGALSAADWTTFNNKGSGTVTSVAQSFTGGLISVAGSPITTSGTLALTVAGTSGGIPYFSSASTWATSALLANNAIMLGGGAAATPKTTTTGTGVVTALGVNTGTAGAFVVNGGALGTPSSGTVTNLTGTASININGTVGATTANTGAFTTLTSTGNASFSTSTGGVSTIGTATPSAWSTGNYKGIEINGGASFIGFVGNAQTYMLSNLYGDGTNYRYITASGGGLYAIQGVSSGAHVWYSAPVGAAGAVATVTQIMSVESSKSLSLQGAVPQTGTGITFPATQSASTNANTLDDYEEGTWTPSFFPVSGSATYTSQIGNYVKIGRQVTVTFYIGVNVSSLLTAQYLAGLPFTGSDTNYAGISFSYWDGGLSTYNNIIGLIAATSTQIQLRVTSAAASAPTAATLVITSGTQIAGSATYFVA